MRRYTVALTVLALAGLLAVPANAVAGPKWTGTAKGWATFHYDEWGGASGIRLDLREVANDVCAGDVEVLIDGEWWTGQMYQAEGNFIDDDSVTVIVKVRRPASAETRWVAFVVIDGGPGEQDRVRISGPADYQVTDVWLDRGNLVVRDRIKD